VTGSERWIDLCDPDDAALEAALSVDVHETALARLRAPARHDDEPRPRLEAHGNYVFGVLVLPTIDENAEATVHELDIVATLDRLVTVRKTPAGGTACDISAIRESALRNDNPPGLNLYYLFDEIAEQFLTVVDRFDDEIDELEDNIGEWPPQRVR